MTYGARLGPRRWATVLAALGLALGVLSPVGTPARAVEPSVRDGTQGRGDSVMPSMSADGRFVVFDSDAPDLVAGDTNQATDVFVRDLVRRRTQRVSVGTDGAQAPGLLGRGGFTRAGAISDNGRFVAFTSADALTPADTNAANDVFVRDLWRSTTRRVSVGAGGEQANGESRAWQISGDGRHVLFESTAANLVTGPAGPAGSWGLYVRDLFRGTTRRVDVTPSGTPGGYPFVQDASITRQGRFVLFVSYASNLVPGDTNRVDDVFLRDLWRGTTRRVNLSVTGEQADNGYLLPYPTPDLGRIASVSADGRFVAFASRALNLVPDGQPNPRGINHIFLRDVRRSTTSRVDVTADGVLEGGFPYQPVISADGGTIVYRGTGDNLVAGLRYVVRDLRHRRGRSVGPVTPTWGPAFRFPHETPPAISAHGDFVAFTTGNGAELVPGVGPFVNVLRWTRRDGTFRQASLGNPAP